jgi:PadR family transcriptional regulator, regulatory protein PadR
MRGRRDVRRGTLTLMLLKTVDILGPLSGYAVGRSIEEASGNCLLINYGTLHPILLKLERQGQIRSGWGRAENNRRARFYELTSDGRKQSAREVAEWMELVAIIERFVTMVSAG